MPDIDPLNNQEALGPFRTKLNAIRTAVNSLVNSAGPTATAIQNLTNNKADKNNPAFTGVVDVPNVADLNDDSLKAANTAFVKAKSAAYFGAQTSNFTRGMLTQPTIDGVLNYLQVQRSYALTPEKFGASANDGITDESAILNTCYQQALLTGYSVRLDRIYVANSNIANFHEVERVGFGKIVANGISFQVEPDYNDPVNLYMSENFGADTNDGLSPSRPIRNFEKINDALQNSAIFGILNGIWTINLAAGTYPRSAIVNLPQLRSRSYIAFKGPSVTNPTVPTAIISGGGANLSFFQAAYDFRYMFEDIKFDNFANGSAFTGGLGSIIYAKNCHVDGRGNANTYGFRNTNNGSILLLSGGIIKNCTASGIELVTNPSATIGYGATSPVLVGTLTMTSGAGQTSGTISADIAASITNGMTIIGKGIPDDVTVTITGNTIFMSNPTLPAWVSGDKVAFAKADTGAVIFGCGSGVYCAEHGMVHLDYCGVFNNTYGVQTLRSRLNALSSHVKGNTIGIYTRDGQVVKTGNTVIDGNTINFEFAPGGFLDIQAAGTNGRGTSGPYRLVGIYNALANHTGTTVQTDLTTLWTVDRTWFQSSSKKMLLNGTFTMNPGGGAMAAKANVAIKLGTTSVIDADIPVSTAGSSQIKFEVSIVQINLNLQYVEMRMYGANLNIYKKTTPTIDFTTLDRALVIAVKLDNAADTARLDHRELYLEGA